MYLMYLRKSRADDASMTVQEVLSKHEQILQEYCFTHYGKHLDEKHIYREIVSGETIEDRPEIKKILELITNNDIEGVLVVEPQRLSRGDMLDCGQIMRIFKFSDTKIITPNKTFDLNDKYDYKFLQMELMQGNEYLEYTKMILQRGRDAARKKGCYIGSRNPYGYTKTHIDKLPTLIPNEEATVVKLIYKLYLDGFGLEKICTELTSRGIKPPRVDYWDKTSIKKILSNELYIGKITHGKRGYEKTVDENGKITISSPRKKDYEIYDGLHEPIIDEETFKMVQAILGRTSRQHVKKELKNAYSGILKCSCGYSLTRQSVSGYPANLFCSHRKYCGNKGIKYDEFTELFIDTLKSILRDFSTELEESTAEKQKADISVLETLEKRLQVLEKKQLKLYEYLEDGTYTREVFKKRNEALALERASLIDGIEKQQSIANNKEKIEAFSSTIHKAILTIEDDSISASAKNIFLKSFIKKIVYDGEIKIEFI